MKNINPDSLPERFSEDPEENLRIENEIMQLTIRAELGGELMQNNELPPEIENEFLKNIIAFEHAFAEAGRIKVYDLLNRPPFKKGVELNDEELPAALDAMVALLEEKNIVVEYRGDYDNGLKYSFITEELFNHETDDIQIPGMISHFCYEEFHPNHKLDIEDSAVQFISNWFEQDIEGYKWSLSDTFILPDGTTLSRDEVVAKITRTFDSYPVFTDHSYDLENIDFKLLDEDGAGLGFAGGTIKYTAVLENRENVEIEGKMKLILSREYGYWCVKFFVFPGFKWD